ncbi:MAG: hypothetical protein ACO3LE_10750, partial [Bdellovibrionota bacterium]
LNAELLALKEAVNGLPAKLGDDLIEQLEQLESLNQIDSELTAIEARLNPANQPRREAGLRFVWQPYELDYTLVDDSASNFTSKNPGSNAPKSPNAVEPTEDGRESKGQSQVFYGQQNMSK